MRQKLLDNTARAQHAEAERQANERRDWKIRMQALEEKERARKEFEASERKIQHAEWQEAIYRGHAVHTMSTLGRAGQWPEYNKVLTHPPLKQSPGF